MRANPHELLVHAVSAWRTMKILGYLDPGSGSYVYQMLIAGLAGVFFYFKTIKRKLLSLFHRAKPEDNLTGTVPTAHESKAESMARRN